ncbi:DgyrCDS1101 [Dimorphilus gyrociliatus]|uniref:Glycylpeptide N-tetradecanoyltransferase n=1 Tax=Dimorphilus gyrociliatus TaxID=2664684 RepID=A0A7I8V6A3_9ANNE|nr:DgyrCDS1101 [Dimorphilus gyrociliatus]
MADRESLVEKSENEGRDSVGSEADVEEEKLPEVNAPKKKTKTKKKKKKQVEIATTSDSDAAPSLAADSLTERDLNSEQISGVGELLDRLNLETNAPKSIEDARKKNYKFWGTQPVPKLTENTRGKNAPIEHDKSVEEIRAEPLTLPDGFIWDDVDINDANQLTELYTLLNENYVEDDDNMFRFDYSPEFLHWALLPPEWRKDWHVGVRASKSRKLLGFISAIPIRINIYDKIQKMVEINFLCVHKKLRTKRVAPVLIREITRRVNITGLFQAVYTAGVVLPKPVSTCRYWHRSLNPKKLIEVRFSHLSRNMTMQRTIRLYRLPQETKTRGFRELTEADVRNAFTLLQTYLNTFNLSPRFNADEFRHWFLPRKGIINSYVVEQNGKLTDFVSFYTLPSTVMQHPNHKSLKAAYSFYNVSTVTPWVDLMQDALVTAKNMDFDVFNALDLMENKKFLEELKFGVGDGNLQYYLYNWACPEMRPDEVN